MLHSTLTIYQLPIYKPLKPRKYNHGLIKTLTTCRDPEMISITAAPEAPPPRIRILDARQREVETVRIGDRLTFRIEIPEDSKLTPKLLHL